MRPSISLISLGLDDLERSEAFCLAGLGLATHGIMDTEFEIGAAASSSSSRNGHLRGVAFNPDMAGPG